MGNHIDADGIFDFVMANFDSFRSENYSSVRSQTAWSVL